MAKRRTTEEFIELSNKVHNYKFTYDKTVYKNKDTKVIITCPIHGDFEQIPHNHLRGANCKKCSLDLLTGKDNYKSRKSTEDFIKCAQEIHGNKYDYSKTVYIKASEKVIITCPIHGDFEQRPHSHKSGQGCPQCANTRINSLNTSNTKEFVEKANKIHNNKYIYTESEYISARGQIKIICPLHGEFSIRAQDHLSGSGCQVCGTINCTAKYLDEPTFLYYIFLPEFNLYKLGIVVTRRGVAERFKQDKVEVETILLKEFTTGKNAFELEQKLLSKYKNYKYNGPPVLIGGSSELLTKNIKKDIENEFN